jgi:hypothetical protein
VTVKELIELLEMFNRSLPVEVEVEGKYARVKDAYYDAGTITISDKDDK